MRQPIVIVLYLSSVILANLLTALLGPWMSVVNAAAFIGLDIVLRDYLHDSWKGRGLAPKMLCLISIGSFLSFVIQPQAGWIGLASLTAFFLAGITDTIFYNWALEKKWNWMARSNFSNILSSAVDSVVFPTMAFGTLLWEIVLLQFTLKFVGGILWSGILSKTKAIKTTESEANDPEPA